MFREVGFSSSKVKKLIFFLKETAYISGRNLQSLKNKNVLCLRKNICEVSTAARENSYQISTTARENRYEANTASKFSRKLRKS